MFILTYEAQRERNEKQYTGTLRLAIHYLTISYKLPYD